MAGPALPDVSSALEHADDAARAAAERLASTGTQLRSQAKAARDGLRGRVEETDLQPAVRKARIGAWQFVRALVGALVAMPGLVKEGLGLLSTAVDDVAERGADVGERALELVSAVPPSKRERRRLRLRTAAWTGAGFGVGLGVGWLLARRAEALVADEGQEQEEAGESGHDDVSPNGPVTAGASARDSGRGA